MRFPESLASPALALALAAVAAVAMAAPPAMTPQAARAEVEQRLKEQLPGVPESSYALGAAAFDEELRRRIEENASAAQPIVEAGKRLWNRKFRDGRSLARCFPNGGRRIATAYPQYDPRLKVVVTLEMAINQCLKLHREPMLDVADAGTMGALVAYVRSLSSGRKVAVRVPGAAFAKFEEGRRLYHTRLGQRNFACASCHVQGAGRRYDGAMLSPAIGQATHFPVVAEGRAVTLHARIRRCLELMGAAPFAAGSEELNHLEYFLTYLANGEKLAPNAWRP